MESQHAPPSLVYISGYGRSGSTLLDTVLNSHSSIFGGGELTWLFESALQKEACSCGKNVDCCPFWRSVFEEVFAALPQHDLGSAARLTLKSESMFGSRRMVEDYVALWSEVFQRIRKASGCTTVVDSSKLSRLAHFRLRLFLSQLQEPTSVVHLVRDPRGIMWSAKRGSNRKLEARKNAGRFAAPQRSLVSWTYANIATELTVRKYVDRCKSIRIRYEDLVLDPAATLTRLGELVNFNLSHILEQLGSDAVFDSGHGIKGNRMRRSGKIVMRFDDEWRSKLPRHLRALSAFAGPLTRRYGY